jgi:phenylacetate-coenzyme A ligase PaaK-like adenylate-forming protein
VSSPQEVKRPDRPDLAELVEGHRQRFGWYGALLESQGVHDGAVRLESLPILDEHLLLEHYYTAEHEDLPGALAYQTSGTSTGRRKTILYSSDDHAAYCSQRAELFSDFLADIVPGGVAVSDVGTGHAAASARTIFREIGFEPHEIDYRRPIGEHVTLLNRTRPDVLFTMPVILDRLLACDDLEIQPRKVIVVGDVAPMNWRRHIAQRLDLSIEDVLDIIGSIEVGAIAYYSAVTGFYHFHGHILPESVEPEEVFPGCGHELAGDQGILVLTSYAREYFPVVRYATNDVVKGLRRIPWRGGSVFACDRLEGRFAGEVKHGERLSSYDICAAVNEAFPGGLFEVWEDGGIEIRIATERVTPDQEAVVVSSLLAANPDVDNMVKAGLVQPISVSAVGLDELKTGGGKRLFRAAGL